MGIDIAWYHVSRTDGELCKDEWLVVGMNVINQLARHFIEDWVHIIVGQAKYGPVQIISQLGNKLSSQDLLNY